MTHHKKKEAEERDNPPIKFVDKRGRSEETEGAAGIEPATEEVSSPYPSVVADLELKLKQAQANFESFKAQQHKEYDAFRERQQRELARGAEQKAGDLLKPFLEVIDNLERAAAQAEPATAEGLGLILTQLFAALTQAGCHRIETAGQPFDPAFMEAVAMQPAPQPEQAQQVAAEMAAGFKLGDRVLRPARVVVFR